MVGGESELFQGSVQRSQGVAREASRLSAPLEKRVREIQDKIPPAEPVKTMVLVIPEKILKNEIQDEIRLVRQCGCGFYVAGEKKRSEIQDSMDS
jgi:hypothetical protein